MNRVDRAVRAKAALLVACFALCECVCVYTKEKSPQIDRADLAATPCWRKGRERKKDGERQTEVSSNFHPD